jgi:hypothetical protein
MCNDVNKTDLVGRLSRTTFDSNELFELLWQPVTKSRWLLLLGYVVAIGALVGPQLTAQQNLHPSWRILLVTYQTTDFTYTDGSQVQHRVIGGLTNAQIAAAETVFQDFVTRDIPTMTRGNMIPSLTIRRAPTPLTSLTSLPFGQWWPSPSDIGANRDLTFDAIFVLWQRVGVDQFSGREEYLSTDTGNSGEVVCSGPDCQTYATIAVAGTGLAELDRANLKHRWGHGILLYYDMTGAAPKPMVYGHISGGPYVQCKTGTSYLTVAESDGNPIPNSEYNSDSGFTPDYSSGTTASPSDVQQCLGVTPAAWRTGGPVTKTGGTPEPPPWVPPTTLKPPADLRVVSIVGNSVTISWTEPQDSLRPTGYFLEGGVSPGSVLASIPTDLTRTTFSFGAPSGAFYIRVHAVSDGLKSAASNEVPIFVNVPGPPAPPVNLLGLADGSQLQLAWQNAGGNSAPTSIALDVTGSVTASLPLPATESFSFSGVPPGTYTFSVRAINGQGSSAPSNPVTLTFPSACAPPQPPAQFTATKSGSLITLSWSLPPSGPAPTGYTLIVAGSYTGAIPLGSRSISANVFPGIYSLRVAATNSCGSSAPTAVQTVVIP